MVEVVLLDQPEGKVLDCGSYFGGPDYEFVVATDGHVYFRVARDGDMVWAGPDAHSFRQIADAWNKYENEVVGLPTELAQLAQLDRVAQLRQDLASLSALPDDLPPDPDPLWSLLLFEVEHGLG